MSFRYELTDHAKERIALREIPLEWLERVLFNPLRIDFDEVDPDLRHALGVIPEYGDRVLRVVYKISVVPVLIITIHFDRNLKGKL